MKISEANKILEEKLKAMYESREAENIRRWFWEDLFHYRGGIDRNLHTKELGVFNTALSKLEEGFPIQYVTGITFFYDLRLEVNDSVLIPRPETEELVYLFLKKTIHSDGRILDVGTGSGCIPISLKKRKPNSEMVAIDVSPSALKVATRNAEKYELKVDFRCVDFLDEEQWLDLGNFDFIISNPPYIDRKEQAKMSSSTLKFEPEKALYPVGDDVLIFYRKLAVFGRSNLSPSGKLFLECNEFNAFEVSNIFFNMGYAKVDLIKDMQGKDRFLVAEK